MSWQTELVALVRGVIGDWDSTNYTYTDSRIEQVIVVGAQLVLTDVRLSTTYVVSVANQTISPDPTTPTRDEAAINLIALRTGCLFDMGKARQNAGNNIKVKDGPSEIDMTRIVDSFRLILEKGACALYEEAKLDLLIGATPGEGILGPMKSPNFLYAMQGGLPMRDRIFY